MSPFDGKSTTRESSISASSLLCGLILTLSACGSSTEDMPGAAGDSGRSGAGRSPAPQPAVANDESRQDPNRWVNSLEFEATGEAEGNLDSDGTDLLLTGGCAPDDGVIRMSFTRGQVMDEDLFQLRIVTAGPVESGQTGSFPLEELGWYDGTFKPDNVPAESTIRVPDAYKGPGTLNIITHVATLQERRMVGTVQGTVEQMAGDKSASISASFDINLSCGIGP